MAKLAEQLQQVVEHRASPETVKAVREEAGKAVGKAKPGFKADLKYSSKELNLQTPIRFGKISANEVQKKMVIRHYHQNISGGEVFNKPSPYHWGWYKGDGTEVQANEVVHYQVFPGTDKEHVQVQPFTRTKVLEIKKLLPATALSEFLIESQYEVWAEDGSQLIGFAEYLSKKDSMAVTKFSFGRGFKESYALLYPLFQNGKFLLVMALTRMKISYQHWMDVKAATPMKQMGSVPVSVLEEI